MPAAATLATLSEIQKARLEEAIARIAPTLEALPGVAIINCSEDGSVLYMNSKGLHLLQTSLSDIQALGPAYHDRYFSPDQAEEYVPRVLEMIRQKDPGGSVTFFQRVRILGYEDWQWHLTSVRPFFHDEEANVLAVISLAQHISPDNHYTRKVARLTEELNFLREHTQQFMRLGKREREVLRMIAQGKTCSEIGEALFISNRTAETHRRNIRRKLGVNSHGELDRFARAFDLV